MTPATPVNGVTTAAATGVATSAPVAFATPLASSGTTTRRGFLGAFFRPQATPPFGVFAVSSPQTAPIPYPRASSTLFGASGYCDAVAANGYSITSGFVVDSTKLDNIVNLGVKWTRTPAPSFFDDLTRIFGTYAFGDFDSAQCALLRHNITPLIALEAGPVQYDTVAGVFSPATVATYPSAADFGAWCGAVAAHEVQTFSAVTRYSLPGNEVNSNPQLFPGGESQISAYSQACYHAVKAAQPASVVYGFELNTDGGLDPAAFVQRLYDDGCRVGTCYDALSIHFSLRYPAPPANTPCYPAIGGDYTMQCITAIQNAAHAPIHVIIGETVYTVPGSVPDEATKAAAAVAEMNTFSASSIIDGASWSNVDECASYPTGFFSDGCLVDVSGNKLPAYSALSAQAAASF